MEIRIVKAPIALTELTRLASEQFGDFIKAAADVGRGVIALGGELHADEERMLLDDGARQEDLWGVNLYPSRHGHDDFIEFDSMINIRPSQGNRTRGVEDPRQRENITALITRLIAT